MSHDLLFGEVETVYSALLIRCDEITE